MQNSQSRQRGIAKPWRHLALAKDYWSASTTSGQQATDLFNDAPGLTDGFTRIGAWSLCHINVKGGTAQFLIGANEDADFACANRPMYLTNTRGSHCLH